MKQSYKVEFELNDTVVNPGVNMKPYQVLESVYLEINGFRGKSYGLQVFLEPDSLNALNAGEFTTKLLEYCYELTTLGDKPSVVLGSGSVSRCQSFETTHRRRITSRSVTHDVISELLHDAIGSLALCDVEVYDSQMSECLTFLNAVRQTTSYADGVSKAGPIVSHRFFMGVETSVPGLTGKRRFIVEHASMNVFTIIGVHTIWKYSNPDDLDAPTVLYTDSAKCISKGEKIITGDGQMLVPNTSMIKPMTVDEVLARMRGTSLPVLN